MRINNKIKVLIGTSIISILIIFIINKIFYKDEINLIKNEELEGNITFVSNRTDKREEIEELIEEFESLNPKVSIELELLGDASNILYKRALVGELPDVTLVPGGINVTDYYKYFLPIDDLGFNRDNIYNYEVGLSEDNHLYCITTSLNWNGFIYNKSIFKEAKIDKLPSTIDEFFDVCERIKSLGVVPIALNYKQGWLMDKWIDFVPYVIDKNLESRVIYDNINILDDNSSIFKSISFVRDIVQNKYCEEDLLSYEWKNCKEDIRDGRVGMFLGNSDFKYQLEDLGMNIDDIGMFPFMGSDAISIYGDYSMGVSKETRYPEASKAFLKFLFEEDRYANAVDILSPLKNSEKNKEFFKELEKFNLPLDIYGEKVKINSEGVNDTHEYYDTLRKSIGIDSSFVQSYSICDNPEEIRNKINSEWSELRKSILLE